MATYDAHATISQDPLVSADFWDWVSAGVRASSIVILLMLSLVLVSALFASRPAQAQQLCGERAMILKDLAGQYSEKPQAMGLSSDGKLIEVLVSPSGSWTILVSSPSKRSCLAATGENWELNRDVVFGPPA